MLGNMVLKNTKSKIKFVDT